jgi:predicted DNA-binding protein with PD1-like motif
MLAPMTPRFLPLRLQPGDDLRLALADALSSRGADSAFVLSGIGSLAVAHLRPAGRDQVIELQEDLELLTLAGTLSADGPHLHATVATSEGRVVGGHVGPGCTVRTTAEVLVAVLPPGELGRAHDARTGYAELVVGPKGG